MFKNAKLQNQDLKSASDFAQWLSEINLFAQETQHELHEVAGLLNLALAHEHRVDLDLGSSLNSNQSAEMSTDGQRNPELHSDSESADSLASLQDKLAKQINSKRTPASPQRPESTGGFSSSKNESSSEYPLRYRDPKSKDSSF